MTHSARGHLAVMTMLALAACGGGDASDARADAELRRDLELAGRVQQAPVVFEDTALGAAPTPKPAAERPTPAPARVARAPERRPTVTPRRPPTRVVQRESPRPSAPEPRAEPVREAPAPVAAPGPARGTIGAGTALALSSNARVCTQSNRPGDKLTARLVESVQGANGAVIPAGATVVLEVAEVEPHDPVEQSRIRFRVRAIDVDGDIYTPGGGGATTGEAEKVAYGRDKKSDQKKVIGGAIAGAIAGQILGRDTRATVIGAAAGAAAGTAVAKRSGKEEACFPAGAPVRVNIAEAVVMRS
jgi:hypothetical protein